MHSFTDIQDAIRTLRQLGYECVAVSSKGIGFSKGTGRQVRSAVLARKGSKFVIRYV